MTVTTSHVAITGYVKQGTFFFWQKAFSLLPKNKYLKASYLYT